jgi:hypothetical protein
VRRVSFFASVSYLIGFYLAFDMAHSALHGRVGTGMIIMFISGVFIYNRCSGKRFFSGLKNITIKDFIFSFSLLISFFLSFNLNDLRNQYLLLSNVDKIKPTHVESLKNCNNNGFCHDVCFISYVVEGEEYNENISSKYCGMNFIINFSISRPDIFYISKM